MQLLEIQTHKQTGSNKQKSCQQKIIKQFRSGRIKFLILFLLAMVVFGNQYAFNNPQALQDSIMEQLSINQTQYDMLYTIFAFPNIFATFIIGFLIDYLGVRIGLIALSFGVVIFQTVVAVGGAYKSYSIMLVGRMLFGIASESLITAQASFVSFWFMGKQLAFALGIAITIPELGNALNSYLTPIIFENNNNLGLPLFLSVGICVLSFVCAIWAAYLDKMADDFDKENNLDIILQYLTDGQHKQIKCTDLKKLKGSYWIIVILCMFAVSLYVCFLDNANQLIQKRFCYTQTSAGRAISIVYIVAACCSAPLGFIIDKVGHRRYFSIACIVIFAIAHLIIYAYPQCADKSVNNLFSGASIGLFLIGVGYCFYANSLVPSIPLVVKKKVTGTAFGIMQMIQSISLAFTPLIGSFLVENAQNQQVGYRNYSAFFFFVGFLGIIFSLRLLFIDHITKRKLDAKFIQTNNNQFIDHNKIQNKTQHIQIEKKNHQQFQRQTKGLIDSQKDEHLQLQI